MQQDGAAFYVGSGASARPVAWVSDYASPGQLNDWPFLGVQDDSYGEAAYRRDVRELMHSTRAGMHAEWVLPRAQEARERTMAAIGDRDTRWQYAYVSGAVHVFCEGYLMAQVFPHGARKYTPLPHAPAEREEAEVG